MQAIVFGATGFIGSHVAEQSTLAGRTVIAPVRRTNGFLESIGAIQRCIDFSDDAALAGMIAPGAVVHVCLANPQRHLALEDLRAIEVRLTGRVIAAAARAGARRVVLLSTVMVYGFSRPPKPIDENYPPTPEHAFCRVALERESVARAVASACGIELTILRPVNAIGRRDRQMAKLFAAAARGIFPLFGMRAFRISAIDARDIGRAMIWLGDLPEAALQTFLVKGYDTSWRELQSTLARVTGKNTFPLTLPRAPMRILGRALEYLVPYGIEPPLTSFDVDTMATSTLFNDAKIIATGFQPRYGLEDSIRDFLGGRAE